MTTETVNMVSQFKTAISQLYGGRLSKLIMFGSYARGEENQDSDIDFLVVLKDKQISALTEIERINDSIYGLMLEHGKIISFVPTTEEKFEHSPNLLYTRVKKEGREI
jgi:uncharacterized protein